MRVPVSWLLELVPLTASVEELAERITMAGIEVEAIETFGAFDPKIVVGELAHVEPIPGKAVFRARVDVGGRSVEVVSGAPNLADARPGTKLAVALPGATLFDPASDVLKARTVTAATLYGVASEGVLCSERELGIGRDHTGVLVLRTKAAPGRPALEAIERKGDWTADVVLVLAILPNAARCQSMLGVAREMAALFDAPPPRALELADVAIGRGAIDPRIEAPAMCRRFSAARVEGVRVTPSPDAIARRLVLSGIDPINNVVDAINYAMVEMGQPMHAYDAARLPALVLSARTVRSGERMRTLAQADGDEPMPLPEGMLVIDSGGEPVALAGVIGGADSKVRDSTTTIELESANFDFIAIRKSQSAAKIFTDSSARFSRGVDPALTTVGIRRVLKLLEATSPGLRVTATGDTVTKLETEWTIELTITDINESLGTSLSFEDVAKLLDRVGLRARRDGDRVTVTVTSAREDVRLPCDVLEEVARLAGYDRLPETMPVEALPMHPRNDRYETREATRDALVRWGLQEIISYTMTSPEAERLLHAAEDLDRAPSPPYIRVLNPTTTERSVMRRTLLPGLLQALASNLRYVDACHLFELGVVVLPEQPSTYSPGLPNEPLRVGIAMTGPLAPASLHERERRDVDFYDLADVIRHLARHLHLPAIELEAANALPYQAGICARVSLAGTPLGFAGAVHPKVAAAFDLTDRRIVAAELDLEPIVARARRTFEAEKPARFPSIEFDISAAVERTVAAKALCDVAREVGGEHVADVTVFDVYAGPQVGGDRKAVGLRATLLAEDRTLTMQEGRAIRDRIAAALTERFGAVIRE